VLVAADFFSLPAPLTEPAVSPAEGKSFPVTDGVVCARREDWTISVERSVGVETVVVEAFADVVPATESFAVLAVPVVGAAVVGALPVKVVWLPVSRAVACAINEERSVGVAFGAAVPVASLVGCAGEAATVAWISRLDKLGAGASDAATGFAGVVGVAGAVAGAVGAFGSAALACGVGAWSGWPDEPSCWFITSWKLVDESPSDGVLAWLSAAGVGWGRTLLGEEAAEEIILIVCS
jgi:hypothetical protein